MRLNTKRTTLNIDDDVLERSRALSAKLRKPFDLRHTNVKSELNIPRGKKDILEMTTEK